MKLELIKTSKISSSPECLARYRLYREGLRKLVKKIMKKTTQSDMKKCARKLDVIHEVGASSLTSQEELNIFLDYMLFHHYVDDQNVINRYIGSKPTLSSLERELLCTLQKVDFGIFGIVETSPYGGTRVEHIFTEQEYLLIDEGCSEGAREGFLIAGNYLVFDEFIMSSISFFEVDEISSEVIEEFLGIIYKYKGYLNVPYQKKHRFMVEFLKYNMDAISNEAFDSFLA